MAAQEEYPGVVHADAVYALDDFKRRMRMKDDALRSAKSKGLKVHDHGTRRYIIGREFIEFLSEQN